MLLWLFFLWHAREGWRVQLFDHDLGCGHFFMVLILKTNLKGRLASEEAPLPVRYESSCNEPSSFTVLERCWEKQRKGCSKSEMFHPWACGSAFLFLPAVLRVREFSQCSLVRHLWPRGQSRISEVALELLLQGFPMFPLSFLHGAEFPRQNPRCGRRLCAVCAQSRAGHLKASLCCSLLA